MSLRLGTSGQSALLWNRIFGFATISLLVVAVAFANRHPLPIDFGEWGRDGAIFASCSIAKLGSCHISKFPAGYLITSALGHGSLKLVGLFQALALASIVFALPKGYVIPRGTLLLALLLVLTPIPWTATFSGSLETTAAVLVFWYVWNRFPIDQGQVDHVDPSRKLRILVFALMVGMWKSTFGVIVIAFEVLFLGLGTVGRGFAEGALPRPSWLAIVGAGTSIIVELVLNLLRFGSLRNLSYLSFGIESNLKYVVLNLAGTLWSPNGGLVVYWGLAIIVIALLVKIATRVNAASRDQLNRVALIFIVLVATGVLSNSLWWSTFGWVSWGNRLIIPYALGGTLYVFVATVTLCESRSPLQLLKAAISLPGRSGATLAGTALSFLGILAILFASLSYLRVSIDSRQVFLNVYYPDQSRPACSAFHNRPQRQWDRHSELWYDCVEEAFRYIPHQFNISGVR